MERSLQTLTRKRIGRRCDLVVRDKAGIEYACGEAGLENEDFDTKVIVESNLKAPKVMHDMFVALAKRVNFNEEAIGKIQVVGFLFSSMVFSCVQKMITDMYMIRTQDTLVSHELSSRICLSFANNR